MRDDAELLRLVAAVLSMYLGERRDRSMGDVYQLQRGLHAYAEGAGLAPADRPRSRALTVLRSHGLSRADLSRQWVAARASSGRAATLDMNLVSELFPAWCWHAIAQVIIDGPAAASEQVERLLAKLVSGSESGPSDLPVSRGTVTSYAAPLIYLTKGLREFHTRGFPCAHLEQWQHLPKIGIPRAAARRRDTSAPPLNVVRTGYQNLDAKLKQRLGAESDDDELDRVRAIPPGRLRCAGVWRPARNLAMYVLAFDLGARIGALCDLKRDDIVRDRGTRPDGSLYAALALRPKKTWLDDEISWKPLPARALRVLDVYLAITDKLLLETPDYRSGKPRPREAPLPNAPLFVGSLSRPNRAMDTATFSQQLAGRSPRPESGRKGAPPLLPRADGGGYSVHRLRGAALQATRQAAHESSAKLEAVDPEALSEALIDHSMRSDRDGYADLSTPAGRQRLSGIGAELNEESLTEDRGARKKRDSRSYELALRKRIALESELARRRQIRSEVAQRAQLERTPNAVLRLLVPLLLDEEREDLENQLRAVEVEIDKLQNDPGTMVPIADDEPAAALTDDFELIERSLRSERRASTEPDEDAPAIRGFLTISEFAEIVDVASPTARRWCQGKVPFPPGDSRNPWEPNKVPLDSSLGPRRGRLIVALINPSVFQTKSRQRLLTQTLARQPAGWSPVHRGAALRRPAYAATDERGSR